MAESAPIVQQIYPGLGIAHRAQARVLVCDGPRLLAFVGVWQPDPFSSTQTRTFARLVPDLRARLLLERDLARSQRSGVLDAALEAIGRPVFVVDERGRLREANAIGQKRLRDDRVALTAQLQEACAGRAPESWTLTKVHHRGGTYDHLIILPADDVPRLDVAIALAQRKWGLTARQSEALRLIAEGKSNQHAASLLCISDRTFESHVAAIFGKVGVTSRGELVAKTYELLR
jgi:DNA-binding CsgD family transcriptional regulator